VVDAGKWRDIRLAEHLRIQIEYEHRGFETGKIRLVHLAQGYTLEIDTVQVDFPAEVITSEVITSKDEEER
jgi:chloramphenicol 3-O-phosphotransferase